MNDIYKTNSPGINGLRRAMSTAVSAEPASVLCCSDTGWALESINKRKTAHYRHPIGPCGHSCVEICLALDGHAVFDFDGRCYSFSPPAIALIRPGVIHCEGYAQRNYKYSMLWLCSSRSALVAFISNYCQQTGWNCNERWALNSAHSKNLFDILVDTNKRIQFEIIRAHLIQIISELYQYVFLKKQHQPKDIENFHSKHTSMLQNLCLFIDNHLNETLTLQDISNLIRLSPNYLNSIFVKWSGESIHHYIIRKRMEKAMQMLHESELLIKQIALEVGYHDTLYFSKAFHRYYGRWPSEIKDSNLK